MGKIYTKSGDKGDTSLIGGKRVSKASKRIEAYGNIDEANAILGLVIANLAHDDIKILLEGIQNELFILGSDLAEPSYPENPYNIPRINANMVKKLEEAIDKYQEEVGEIQYFILPGGSKTAALTHFARTIVRRAERSIIELKEQEEINPSIIEYVNRLSDLLFILARVINKREGIKDIPWKANT
ncbi:MAG: cob(I)yrinic acid a,c-diamide adenosyltransferase [Candidatus Nitrosothermus koennekii]|nr:MAG: cob(I)yrinic acid a,c-diamide adenosyltransferase [Candidatus Nitrosothermus koennekii]